MIIKKNASQGRVVIAICDEDILGKQFEEGKKFLDLKADFYQGDKFSIEETKKVMQAADHLNLVGEKTIALAKELQIISDDNIRTIDGIPYAQSSRLEEF